jgi:hypothetical protein
MAWNTITFACGHTEEQQLYGKVSERERTVAAALNHNCPACRATKAAAADNAAGLPALQGTEKQIGWASECRAKLLPLLDAQATRGQTIIARIDAGEADGKAPAERIAAERAKTVDVIAKIERIKANTKAGYWIDNRSANVLTMLNEAK